MNKGFNEKNEGITLIALVVTIVVLLILAGVSLNAVIGNSGIITRTQEASKETDIAETKEQILMELMGIYAGSGDYTNDDVITAVKKVMGDDDIAIEVGQKTVTTAKGNEVDISDLWKKIPKVGDYVNYTYDTAENYVLTSSTCGSSSNSTDGIPQTTGLKWRILNIDENTGKIDLISDTPTSTTVYFSGSLGYNNGVYLINDICAKQYSNSSLGITARNLTIEDIENGMNETGLAARDEYTNGTAQYGTTKTYTGSYSYYPNLYAQENGAGINAETVKTDGIGLSDKYYITPTKETYNQASDSGLTVTQTYYSFSSPSAYFDDSNFYSMIFGTSPVYWLASRFANCSSDRANFGLRYVNDASLQGGSVFNSISGGYNFNNRLRPVVSLDSNLLDGTKDESGAWQIATN